MARTKKPRKLTEADFVAAVGFYLRKKIKGDDERRAAAAQAAVTAYCADNGAEVGDDAYPWDADHAKAVAAGWQDEA